MVLLFCKIFMQISLELMKGSIVTFFILGLIATSCLTGTRKLSKEEQNPRLIITTDIGGDPDDTQSMVRLLVSSNEFDIEGIIASASGTINELDTAIVRTDLVLQLIDAYAEVQHSLEMHDPGFLVPADLKSVVKHGNPKRGLEFIGEGMDTEGSQWIESRILSPDARPLNISIWGGQSDVVIEKETYTGSNDIHLVLEVRDSGQPSLTTYRRVIIMRSS